MRIRLRDVVFLVLIIACQNSFSGSNFFNISASGTSANVNITLCLNGKGPVSCQNYNVSALTLSLLTTIPNHTYSAGIKINTPGYTLSGCSMQSNEFCLFSVGNTTPAVILLIPSSCQPDVIIFSPSVTQVNNPTGSTPNPPQTFSISMTTCNSHGEPLIPSQSNPIHVDVYGAPAGVITPTSTTTSTGTVTFTYNGQSFPNNILINAWISDSTNQGAALGVTQVLKQNTPSSCTYGNIRYRVPLVESLPGTLKIKADVGYDTNAPLNTLIRFTIDTGSLGVVLPISDLPKNANVIGPGAIGVKYYGTSGDTYSGNYYLAPVRIETDSGVVETAPIMVLAIDKAYCMGPITQQCYSNPPSPTLRYLGVGFDRNSTAPNDLFNSPTANAFLHVMNANNGTDLGPGYDLTPHDSTEPSGLTLGITSNAGYNVINLTPNSIPGDFNAQPGCYSFPSHPAHNQFCGTALLDTGIASMYLDLPRSLWPRGTYNARHEVPAGIDMSVLMGDLIAPAMQYSFTTVNGTAPPHDSPTPTIVNWIDNTQVFVNTGRRPLYIYNYFYEGQCGQVGFKSLP